MGSFDEFLKTLGATAKAIAATAVPGAPSAIVAAKALGTAFDHLKSANGGKAPPTAQADRDAAMARVLKHADDTASRLEGN